MSRDVIDIALLRINGVELQEVSSFDITETDAGAETVKTMRRSRVAIGHKKGVSEFEISLEVMPVNPPEVDYLALKQANTQFPIIYQENVDGPSFQCVDCRVTEVNKTFNADGEATLSVTILALNHRKSPT